MNQTKKKLDDVDTLLNTKEAASFLDLKPGTLAQYRWRGMGPPFIKGKGAARRGIHSGAVRYRLGDLKAWRSEGEWIGEEEGDLSEEEQEKLKRAKARHPSRPFLPEQPTNGRRHE